MDMKYQVIETDKMKFLKSENYNYSFDKETGFFLRWGRTIHEDVEWSQFGPEIADIEVTSICHGITNTFGERQLCKFCYKNNTPNGVNMTYDMFVNLFNKFPRTLTQIAFGADSQGTANPRLFDMMDYCRHNDYQTIIPNITIADISEETAKTLIQLCGAVAVSCYMDRDKNVCYNIVERLSQELKQTNIHMMVSKESLEYIKELFYDYKHDKRLSKLNAIVLLSLKQKGRGIKYNPASQKEFNGIVNQALENKIPIGFDSCSCPKFLNAVRKDKRYKAFYQMSEPCESSLYSSYINTHGFYYPCSFMDGQDNWKKGLDVITCNDFIEDIWLHNKTDKWRKELLKSVDKCNIRKCPVYNV